LQDLHPIERIEFIDQTGLIGPVYLEKKGAKNVTSQDFEYFGTTIGMQLVCGMFGLPRDPDAGF
jgi:hypothetical protein